MSWEVLDISRYNTISDYSRIPDSVSGVIMRVGYRGYGSSGSLIKDSKFDANYNGLRGLTKIGYYWETQAISDDEAIAEANFVYAIIGSKQCDFPIYVKSVYGSNNGSGRADDLSVAERTQYLISFLDRLTDLGFRGGIYATDIWFATKLDQTTLAPYKYSYWVEKESEDPPTTVAKFDGWDYTSSGSCTGVNGYVSRSIFYNDVAGWDSEETVDINSLVCYLRPTTVPYTGSPVETNAIIEDLVLDEDYSVEFTNNVDAGLAYATLTGIFPYVGTKSLSYTIAPRDMSETEVTLSAYYFQYTGLLIRPDVTVTFNGMTLVQDIDYKLTFSNNINPGTATATVTGMGNYIGSNKARFTITSKPFINDKEIILPTDYYVYTGSPITPEPTIEGLTLNVDYTVSYQNNNAAGTATITCTGKGNYTGSTSKDFEIAPKNLGNTDVEVTLPSEFYSYTGSPITPDPIVKVDGVVIQSFNYDTTYEDNINIGTASVTVTGKGNYTGGKTTTFTIESSDLAKHKITISPITCTYDGTEKTVNVTVEGLSPSDYYIEGYDNNINAGTAQVTIVGQNNTSGTVIKTFTIKPKPINDIPYTVEGSEFLYTSGAITPKVDVEWLEEGKDFTVKYYNNVKPGTAKLVITGIGNYTGTINYNYTILPRDVLKLVGKYGTPSIKTIYRILSDGKLYMYADDVLLTEGKDYSIISKDILVYKDFSVYRFDVRGINGGITGTATFRFRIIDQEPPEPIDLDDDGVYNFGDIDEGDETAEGNYDFGTLDVEEDPEPEPIAIDYSPVFNPEDEEDPIEPDEDEGDEEPSDEDDPSVAVGDYDFDSMSTMYLAQYDADTGLNIDDYGNEPGEEDVNPQYADDGVYNFGDIDVGDETAEGDYDFGDLDEGTSEESVAIGDYDFNVLAGDMEEGMDAGTPYDLDNTPIYANYCSSTAYTFKSGRYYIYNSKVANNRIRITKYESAVDEPVQSTGWVDMDDLANLGTIVVGDRVKVKGKIYKYASASAQDNSYIEKNDVIMYVQDILENLLGGEHYDYPYGLSSGPKTNIIGWASEDIISRLDSSSV